MNGLVEGRLLHPLRHKTGRIVGAILKPGPLSVEKDALGLQRSRRSQGLPCTDHPRLAPNGRTCPAMISWAMLLGAQTDDEPSRSVTCYAAECDSIKSSTSQRAVVSQPEHEA